MMLPSLENAFAFPFLYQYSVSCFLGKKVFGFPPAPYAQMISLRNNAGPNTSSMTNRMKPLMRQSQWT